MEVKNQVSANGWYWSRPNLADNAYLFIMTDSSNSNFTFHGSVMQFSLSRIRVYQSKKRFKIKSNNISNNNRSLVNSEVTVVSKNPRLIFIGWDIWKYKPIKLFSYHRFIISTHDHGHGCHTFINERCFRHNQFKINELMFSFIRFGSHQNGKIYESYCD